MAMVPLLFTLITPAWRLKSSPQMPGSLSSQVEKQQFQIKKLFNGRGCQRPTIPAGADASIGTGLARGGSSRLAGGGRTFGRWKALWVFLIMMRCMAEGGKSSPALLVPRARSALHQLRALHCAPVTEREGGKDGQKGGTYIQCG